MAARSPGTAGWACFFGPADPASVVGLPFHNAVGHVEPFGTLRRTGKKTGAQGGRGGMEEDPHEVGPTGAEKLSAMAGSYGA